MIVQRTITMTVYAIVADQIDCTQFGQRPNSHFLNGRIVVKAHGEGHVHEWPILEGQRCWPGDTVQVTVIEEHDDTTTSTSLTPPPIDTR